MDTREKAKKTLSTIQTVKLIVACSKCGSTKVGLRGNDSLDELVCDSCGASAPWDGEKFTLIKYDERRPHSLKTLAGLERAIKKTKRRAAKRSDETS
ncbi:MAG TPA: hypothetical protein HPP83_00800 [Candidatus Hydrogenedentes bacterium]|nr:hypothetical protein [Candidatus Hydrogenedentota bacterium]